MPSRREFFKTAVPLAAAGWSSVNARKIEYVVTANSIDVIQTLRSGKLRIESVKSAHPTCLVVDSDRNLVFAVNEISEYRGLPSGSVESYAVDPGNGHLALVSRQALSLSAIMPRSLAISPDGRYMVVAVYGGGAYNVLPVHSNGELGSVSQIVKEIGMGPRPENQSSAHPHSVVFHPSGNFVIGTDTGSDRINIFGFHSGRLTCLNRVECPAGSGPAQIAMSPNGSVFSIRHAFHSSRFCYRFHPQSGSLTLNS